MCAVSTEALQQVANWIAEDVERLLIEGFDVDPIIINDVLALETVVKTGHLALYPSFDFDLPTLRSL